MVGLELTKKGIHYKHNVMDKAKFFGEIHKICPTGFVWNTDVKCVESQMSNVKKN